MKKEEDRFEKALEHLLSGKPLPEAFLESLSADEREQLHMAVRLKAVKPPRRDPEIVADQLQTLKEIAATNRQRKPAVFENLKSGWTGLAARLSWRVAAFGGVLLLILMAGVFAAGNWLSPEIGVVNGTNPVLTPSEPVEAEQPAQESDPSYEFIDIESVLAEIDQGVCREALATQAEIEALLAQGTDLAELETAVDELIAELGNCPQTVLLSEQIKD